MVYIDENDEKKYDVYMYMKEIGAIDQKYNYF